MYKRQVGIGITVFSFAGKFRDSDIDDQVENVRKSMVDEAMKAFGFTERQLRNIVLSKDFGEYVFPEDGQVHIKRGSDGKFRSSEYTAWSVSPVSYTHLIDNKYVTTDNAA